MHAVFFSIKRANLRILACTRPVLVGTELTPARFDLLRVVLLHKHGIGQRKLCALLGVSGATVSRMLSALEKRRLVRRERAYRDLRRKLVLITDLGIMNVMTALDHAVHTGVAEQMAAAAATGERGVSAALPQSEEKVASLQRLLGRMRVVFGDRCPYPHPWRTGDLVPMGYTTLVDGRLFYQESA